MARRLVPSLARSTATERIARLLDPAYSDALPARSDDELRAMKQECIAHETSVSFYRRLAQARIEIIQAEQQRRARGAPLTELIDALPGILAGGGRSSAAQSRVVEAEMPEMELHWPDGRERLVADETLATLPELEDSELAGALEDLAAFERDLSELRHRLHGVIDGIEHELATRQAAGTTG